jgi:DNA-binding HxlR family transcriptional regulator
VSRDYEQFCGLAHALEVLGGRWTLLVIRDLLTGPKRFTELQRGLPKIPSNVLTSRLRDLEINGVVARQVLPRGFAYALTDYGHDLDNAMLHLGVWGARGMAPRRDRDFWSIHSIALALRGTFRPGRNEDLDGLYKLSVDNQALCISVADGQLSTTASTTGPEPEVIIETDPQSVYQFLAGTWDSRGAVSADHARISGDVDRGHRFLDAFRLVGPASGDDQ